MVEVEELIMQAQGGDSQAEVEVMLRLSILWAGA